MLRTAAEDTACTKVGVLGHVTCLVVVPNDGILTFLSSAYIPDHVATPTLLSFPNVEVMSRFRDNLPPTLRHSEIKILLSERPDNLDSAPLYRWSM